MADFDLISTAYGIVGDALIRAAQVQPSRPGNPAVSLPDASQDLARAKTRQSNEELVLRLKERNNQSDAFLKHIDELRKTSFDWDGNTLWDARVFSTSKNPLPSPFDRWAPFISIQNNLFNTEAKTFDLNIDTYAIPYRRGLRTLQCTYIDSEDLVFTRWLRKWVTEEIHNNGLCTTPLVDASKEIQFVKLNRQKKIVMSESLFVIPEGQFNYAGESDGGFPTYDMTFNIVGTGAVPNPQSTGTTNVVGDPFMDGDWQAR